MSDASPFERNLRALLARAYVAERADPAWRARAELSFLARHAELCRPPRPAPAGEAARPARLAPYAAAAALLILVGAALWLRSMTPAPSPLERILAGGDAAVREAPEAPWRAHSTSVGYGWTSDTSFEACTPATAALRVEGLPVGTLRIEAGGRARLQRDGDGRLTLAVLLGGVVLADGRWVRAPAQLRLDEPQAEGALPDPAERTGLGDPTRMLDAPTASRMRDAPPWGGRVVDAETGTALADFRVVLVPDDFMSGAGPVVRAFRQAGGAWSWDAPTPAAFALWIVAEGYAPHVFGALGQPPGAPLDAALARGSGPVRGRVLGAEDGRPVAGALVVSETDAWSHVLGLDPDEAAGEAAAAVLTDAEGRFELRDLRPGPQVLRASAPGFAPAWIADLTLDAGETREDLELRLGAEARVSGTVYSANGAPFARAMVLASFPGAAARRPRQTYQYAFTDHDGRYELRGLPSEPGVVLLLGRPEEGAGGPPEIRALTPIAGRDTVVDFGEPVARPRLHGTIVDHAGAPLAGLTLSLTPEDTAGVAPASAWRGLVTDASGRFEFPRLAPGRWQLFAGRGAGTQLVLVRRLEMLPGGDHRLDLALAGGRISGRVVDAGDGAPISAALVILLAEEGGGRRFAGRVIPAADGTWELPFMGAGEYHVVVLSTGSWHAPARSPTFTLASDLDERVVDVALPPGGAVEVFVRDEEGRPVAAAHVSFVSSAGESLAFSDLPVTDAEGRYASPGLPTGAWQVRVEAEGFATAIVPVAIELGVSARLDVALTR